MLLVPTLILPVSSDPDAGMKSWESSWIFWEQIGLAQGLPFILYKLLVSDDRQLSSFASQLDKLTCGISRGISTTQNNVLEMGHWSGSRNEGIVAEDTTRLCGFLLLRNVYVR